VIGVIEGSRSETVYPADYAANFQLNCHTHPFVDIEEGVVFPIFSNTDIETLIDDQATKFSNESLLSLTSNYKEAYLLSMVGFHNPNSIKEDEFMSVNSISDKLDSFLVDFLSEHSSHRLDAIDEYRNDLDDAVDVLKRGRDEKDYSYTLTIEKIIF
jgi:hypothetical protein